MHSKSLLILTTALCLARLALAQDFRASISGLVTDPSGAPVAGAKVKATDIKKNTATDTVTNDAGRYSIGFLLPGEYALSIEAAGFKTFVRSDIVLNINARLAVDARLELGQITESVTVSGEVTALDTETASRGGLVMPQFIDDVPNRGRNMFELAFAMPGVYKPSTSQANQFGIDAIGNATPQINGATMGVNGRQWDTDVLINGTSNTQGNANLVMTPALASIQEMKVMTNTYDAAYGHTGGGIINVTTKSGTNTIHGQLFDRYFSDALRANSWNNNRTGTPKTHTHYNTYGFEADGPIYIPKVADLRNKMFLMVSMERTPNNAFNTYTGTTPLPEMVQGNFSNLFAKDGKSVAIYDPTTTRLGPDGKTYFRDPFAGNLIPQSRINPVAAKIFSYFPQPSGSGVGPAHTNNYTLVAPNDTLTPQWFGRLDYHLNDNNVFYGEYGETYYTRVGGYQIGPTNPADPTTQNPRGVRGRHLTLDWSRTFSPTLTLDLRGGFARAENIAGTAQQNGFNPATLGFPPSLLSQLAFLSFPQINFGTYQTMGGVGYFTGDDTYHVAATLSKVVRSHTLKAGVEIRSYRDTTISPGAAGGSYTFNKGWTQANPLQGDTYSGNEIASFLLGYPAAGSVPIAMNPAWRSAYTAIYFQDDWKVRSNLTLNLGLRYDYESPPVERYNRQNRGFNTTTPSPIAAAVASAPGVENCPACPALVGAYQFAGSGGDQRFAYPPIRNNFSPRFGVSWQPLQKTVVRGGIGVYKLPVSNPGAYGGYADGFSRTTPMITSLDGLTPANTLSNPFPGGILQPVGSALGASTNLGLGVSYQYQGQKTPTSYQYSFGIERELPRGFVVDVSYVGNYTNHIGVGVGPNFIPISALNQPVAYYSQRVTNPMAGLLPNNAALNGATIPRSNLLVPYPQYAGIGIANVPIGKNRYDSFQAEVKRRFANGLTFTANYSIAKTLEQLQFLNAQFYNPSNPDASTLDKRLTPFDVPQKASILGTYELPYGRGKRFGSQAWRPLRYAFGDWKPGWNFTLQEGFPVDFPNAAPLVAQSAKLPIDQLSMYRWFDTSIFPKVAGPAPFTLRNFPSRFPDVRFHGLHNFDASLMKDFPVVERLKLELRADFTNLCNSPFFTQMQSLDVTNSTFAQIRLGQNNDPRVIYMEFKLLF